MFNRIRGGLHVQQAVALLAALLCLVDPAHARAFNALPGALVKVTFNSTVATRIPSRIGGKDQLPDYLVQLITDGIENPPRSYWRRKAVAQARLMLYRQIYRRSLYPNGTSTDPELIRGQLTFPPQKVWKIVVDPQRKGPQAFYRKGRKYIGVEYSFQSVLVARRGSIKRAEPALASVNGSYTDSWFLPIDPEFLFQRTGYACMDEGKGPLTTITANNAWLFFNDKCVPKSSNGTSDYSCHVNGDSKYSCLQALRDKTGGVTVKVTWTRIPYRSSVANAYRVGNPQPDIPRDLVNQKSRTYRIFYKYFSPDSCLVGPSGCVKQSGWRRLLTFKTSTYNAGVKRFLNIARIGNDPNATSFVSNEVYKWNQCINNYVHTSFLKIAFGSTSGQPLTACIHDSLRVMNNEYSPMATQYDTCEWQGISAGWAHQINDGVPCNWIDITDISPKKQTLRSVVNPLGFVCEGDNIYTPRPKHPIFYPNDTAGLPPPTHRPACNRIANYKTNNVNSNYLAIRGRMASVTMRCPVGVRPMTELRNCGWTMAKERVLCQPGAQTTLAVNVESVYYFNPTSNETVYNNPTVVVRVCESSWALGNTSIRCEFADALAHGIIAPSSTANITFTCPTARDSTEPGGLASVLIAKYAAFENLGFPVPNVTVTAI